MPDLPADADNNAVKEASSQLIELINGAAKLYNDKFEGVTFVKVTIEETDGKRRGYGYLTLEPRDFELTAMNPDDITLATWVDQGYTDPEVSRALSIYGGLESNWRNLYLVLEVIEDDIGGEIALKGSGLVQPNILDLFKHTANSYRAIGEHARHASLSREPPSKSMSIKEAQKFIQRLLRAWMASKKQSA